MVPQRLLEQVARQAREHCATKGYVGGPNWNPLEPQNCVAALAMARRLVGSGGFDHYVAVAPEGHAYGFFFERLGARVLSAFVDYPPRQVTGAEGLSAVRGGRVLLIEDDVVSGVSLDLVVAALRPHRPASVSVYLGRRADSQCPENVRLRSRRCSWRSRTWARPTGPAMRPSSFNSSAVRRPSMNALTSSPAND